MQDDYSEGVGTSPSIHEMKTETAMSSMPTHARAHSIVRSAARRAPGPIKDVTRALEGMASDLSYKAAQARGEHLARKMNRDGSLKAGAPRKVIQLPK
jgi:hypothetical protein